MLSSYKSFTNVILTDTATLYTSRVRATHMDVNHENKPELLFPWLFLEPCLHWKT